MKSKIILYLIFTGILLTFLFFQNCGEATEPDVPNKAPTCSISSPSNNAAIGLGAITTITVSANDTDGSVANVKISIDDVNAATLQSSPYSYEWNTASVSTGQHNIKAVATDDGGLTAISQIIVTVTADAPSVTTSDITEITATTATGGGNITDDGGVEVTARGVVWGESSGPTLESNLGKTEDGTGKGIFTSSLTSLTAAKTYYVKAYATNSGGTAYGEEKSFTTGGLPVVETVATLTDITNSTAEGSGEVTDDGGSAVTARGLVWGPWGEDPTLETNTGFTTNGTGTGTFTSSLTSLTRATKYTVRAYATNSAGTSYGAFTSFTTLPDPPTVTLSDITDIWAHVALCSVTVTDDGGAANVSTGIVWSTTQNPDESNFDGQWYNSTDAILSALKPETKYYVRAYATNVDNIFVYSEEKTFTTLAFDQIIQTGSFTDSRDNNQYSTVTISDQTWMAENLAYLPNICGPDSECGYWVYGYNGSNVGDAKATPNYTTYGALYNWEMAKAACPTGWRLPTDYDWSYLEVQLGISFAIIESDAEGLRGTDQGGKMKEAGELHWDATNLGANNSSGFTGLPGGLRDNINKNFQALGAGGYFWSSTQDGNWVNYRFLVNSSEQVGSDWASSAIGNTALGGSVRCLKE